MELVVAPHGAGGSAVPPLDGVWRPFCENCSSFWQLSKFLVFFSSIRQLREFPSFFPPIPEALVPSLPPQRPRTFRRAAHDLPLFQPRCRIFRIFTGSSDDFLEMFTIFFRLIFPLFFFLDFGIDLGSILDPFSIILAPFRHNFFELRFCTIFVRCFIEF